MNEFWGKKGRNFFMEFLLVAAVAVQFINAEESTAEYYAQSGAKLKELARMDFETVKQLRNLRENLETSSHLAEVVNR